MWVEGTVTPAHLRFKSATGGSEQSRQRYE